MPPKKKSKGKKRELTDKKLIRQLFPEEVVRHVEKEVEESDRKGKRKKR